MTKLEQVIYKFRGELGGDFISTDVVGLDGISIAGGSIDPDFDANEISARFAEVMKLAKKISEKIDIGDIDDNLVTTEKNYIITRFLGNSSFFWVVVTTSNATLGTLRILMNEYAPQILEAIPTEDHHSSSTTSEVKNEAPAVQEGQPKEKKSRRINFWADKDSDKEDLEKDAEKHKNSYMFP